MRERTVGERQTLQMHDRDNRCLQSVCAILSPEFPSYSSIARIVISHVSARLKALFKIRHTKGSESVTVS